jgi:PAS domain S-box-containing protein
VAAAPDSRRWAAAGVAAVLLVFLVDRLTSANVALVTLSAVGPLIAAAGAGLRPTIAVAVLATVLALVELALAGPFGLQDDVRVLTVLVVSTLAVVLAGLRERLEQRSAEARTATRQAEETLALLDVIFGRAPVGLAFHGLDGRYVRVNDHLAEINGRPPEEHIGHTLAEILPELPEVGDDVRRVAETGRPSTGVEVRGETPAQPGIEREWVASYWPVRATHDGDLIGVGAVVFDVTDRRAAERALRTQTDRYETLLEALSEVGEGMVVTENGRCVYANHAFEQLSGYTFPELTALESLYELVEPEERAEAQRRARLRTERGVVDTTYTLAMRRRDGGHVMLELAGVPLEIAGPPARSQLVVVVRDVTARRRAETEREQLLARSALLAEASALFDQSLDEERTLRSVAELCVRDLADTCLVVLGSYPGPARRTIAVARDPERERALAAEPVLDGRPGDPVATVLRTGAPHVGDAHVVVPLSARGRALGALSAGFDGLGAGQREDALALLEDLGRRAALALDNARLYAERSAIATTLQRSLLPPELPRIPGAQLAARYRASGDGIEIGGDFYDCFATGGGDWALVIGDVCGKGAEAAAITALARYTLRASVLHSRRPAQVLAELNEALRRQGLDYRFCTVLYASVTPRPDGCDVVLATGGHPLPLVLRADGEVEQAGAPGTLLGIVREPEISEERVSLGNGDTLVLYTDGVVEASPLDDALAPERLADLLRTLEGRDAGAIAEAIEDKALEVQDGRLRDDVAVVVLRVGGQGPFHEPGAGVAQPA